MNQFLYFPRCRISRSDTLPSYGNTTCTFLIKSLQPTPKHYPEHFMLKGKVDLFFKLAFYHLTLDSVAQFHQVLGNDANIERGKDLIGKKVSVLAIFNPNLPIILECIAIGEIDAPPILFNNKLTTIENEGIVKVAMLNYKLTRNNKETKDKRQKI